MHNPVTPLLVTYAAAGGVMLLSGLVAMTARKANTWHRTAGITYAIATTIVGVTGFIIAVRNSNQFLMGTSVFVLYMVVSAYRSLYLKQLYKVVKAEPVDWLILAFAAAASVFLVTLGGIGLLHGHSDSLVPVVFGIICLVFTNRDVRKFMKGPDDKKHWLYNHISGMVGSYIAGVTAFLAVNAGQDAGIGKLAVWLLPTIVGTPLIIYWIHKYKKKTTDLKQELGLKINTVEEPASTSTVNS